MHKWALGIGLLLVAVLTMAFGCAMDIDDAFALHALDVDVSQLEKEFPFSKVEEASWDGVGLHTVTVDNPLGNVRVSAWDEPRVQLTLTVRAKTQRTLDEVSVALDQAPGELRWRTQHPGSKRARWTVAYELKVPVQMNLKLTVGAGGIAVEGLVGEFDIDLGAGQLELSELDGALKLDVGAGEAHISGFTGENVQVDMGVGEFSFKARPAAFFDAFQLDLGTGEATLHGVRARTTSLDVGTGQINLGLPRDADYNATLEVDIGEIQVDGFNGFTHSKKRFMGEQLNGVLGMGNGQLSAQVGMGEIHLFILEEMEHTLGDSE